MAQAQIVRMPSLSRAQRNGFATAADTFDIDALMSDLDGRGSNSSSYRQGAYEDDYQVAGRRLRAA